MKISTVKAMSYFGVYI